MVIPESAKNGHALCYKTLCNLEEAASSPMLMQPTMKKGAS